MKDITVTVEQGRLKEGWNHNSCKGDKNITVIVEIGRLIKTPSDVKNIKNITVTVELGRFDM